MKHLLDIMKRLNENKNGKVITFDFDNTIAKSFENSTDGNETQHQFGGINKQIIARIKKFKKDGATVFVVSSRNDYSEIPESSVKTMLDNLNIKIDGIFYTNGEPKARKLYELGSSLHYDDDPKEHEAIKAFSQLHNNFNIALKYPDDLISDINEVAKGLIMTSDGRFIVVQRSDSLEWDAAGGHLMEGEEAPFALWREIKEEMGLEVKQVEYLDSRDTMWKKKNKLVHYFLSMVPQTCPELEGIIQLQWELENYFCGTLEDIEEKLSSPDGATENLKNVVHMLLGNDDLLLEMEAFQKKMAKGHSKMKSRILRRGPNDDPPASGMKNVTDMTRSKSAPPGFGAMGEQKDTKKTKKLKITIKKDLDEKKKRKKRKKKRKKRSTRSNKYHWGVSGWDYGGGYGDSSGGGGDGGGGE